jgi:import inner membrane translocase subunit TIM13
MDTNSLQGLITATIFQEMIAGTVKACYEKCVTRPGNSLSATEKQCLAMCQDRFQEAFNTTFQRQYENLASDLSREHSHSHDH